MDAGEGLADWLRLTLIPGIGGETQRKLLAAFGLPETVFAASPTALRQVIGDRQVTLLRDTDNAEAIARALDWAATPGQRILTLADADYPQALLEIPDPPSLLYVRGRVELLNRPALAIVGSRHPTPQGLHNARQFSTALAETGLCIVSGLALGIDAAAHEGALDCNGDTIAVIGTGNDRIYPARNRELAIAIAERGCIISEFPLGTPVAAANFPRRNRLISGLARGVLVVEASVDSGSLITARLAAEQGREVCAIPGSIHSPQSRGCHKLLKQGAKLVETAQDVLEELRLEIRLPPAAPAADVAVPNEGPDEARVLALLGYDPCPLDTLVTLSGLTPEALSVMLLRLELGGRIAALPGGRYQRLPSS